MAHVIDGMKLTRREFLSWTLAQEGYGTFEVEEAIDELVAQHPEWDMNLKITYRKWVDHYKDQMPTTRRRTRRS